MLCERFHVVYRRWERLSWNHLTSCHKRRHSKEEGARENVKRSVKIPGSAAAQCKTASLMFASVGFFFFSFLLHVGKMLMRVLRVKQNIKDPIFYICPGKRWSTRRYTCGQKKTCFIIKKTKCRINKNNELKDAKRYSRETAQWSDNSP